MNGLVKNNLKLFFEKMIQKRGVIVSFASVFVGIVSGCVIYNLPNFSAKSKLFSLFTEFNTQISDKTFIEIFSAIFLSGITYFVVMLFLGGNIFGKEVIFLFTAIKASGIGALISFLYNQYGAEGLEYTFLVFIPGKVFLLFSMLLLTECCSDTSKKLHYGLSDHDSKFIIKIYILKCAIAFGVMFASWLIDFLCIVCFSKLFSFT